MMDKNTEDNSTKWPRPRCLFQVEWDEHMLTFEEVIGLEVVSESDAIEYHHPSVNNDSRITLKRGEFVSDNNFWGWYDRMRIHQSRSNMLIKLVDDNGSVSMVWQLNNAWPTQIIGTDLNDKGDNVAIEEIEITFASMSISEQ